MLIKSILTLSLFTLATALYADAGDYGQSCLSHGECQEISAPIRRAACFVVKTGRTASGKDTCTLRCYNILAGNYCNKLPGQTIGLCQEESFPRPSFDPANPDCSFAIEPPIL